MGDEDAVLRAASLRELAHRLERAGGVLFVVRDGSLSIRAAAGVLVVERDDRLSITVEAVNPNVVRLGGVLTRASAVILAAVKHEPGPINPDDLPDAELTVGGGLLPPKLLEQGQVEPGDRGGTPSQAG